LFIEGDYIVDDSLVGKKGMGAQFDETRLLRMDLASMEWIEENALSGRAIAINVVMNNINRTKFLKTVLRAVLGMKDNAPIVPDDQIQAIYDGYIEKTGSREDLEKLLIDVYELAIKNPMKSKKAKEAKTEDPGGKS
jgi:hypothetical protein